jgi:ribosomal protein S18 acetylase RimI-like enzyme
MTFRLARPDELSFLANMIVSSFEPITWFKSLDREFGPLNGCDWRERWRQRLDKVFATQIILAGEVDGAVVAAATGTYDEATRLGFVDLLAVDAAHQSKGYGRLMLRGMLDHFRSLGAEHAHLECLSDNTKGNSLYRSEGWTEVARSVKWFTRL